MNRLNYYVVVTVSHLERSMYLLGYIPNDNRLYLRGKELNVVRYSWLIIHSAYKFKHKILAGILY